MKKSQNVRIFGNALLIIYASIIFTLYFSQSITHISLKNLIFLYWVFRCCIYEVSVHLLENEVNGTKCNVSVNLLFENDGNGEEA